MIFFFFLILTLAFSYMVVSQKILKTLLSLIVIYLVLVPLMIFLNFDYVALIMILLYVGAVAVFFLFVLMTTKIQEKISSPSSDRESNRNFLESPIRLEFFSFRFLGFLCVTFFFSLLLSEKISQLNIFSFSGLISQNKIKMYLDFSQLTTIDQLGQLIFVNSLVELGLLALLLFSAAIGAMFFTEKNNSLSQNWL
jgi:NADH:ubiquinone oxidoreductase subunit 6 (subunit J)